MKRVSIFQTLIGITLCTILMGMTGCTKNDGEGKEIPGPGNQKEIFNFSTRSTYMLDVKYEVPLGYAVYFEVYAENPLVDNNRGELVKRTDILPIDKGYTDDKGAYKKPIVINSAIEKLYIYTPYVGVTKLLCYKVENGMLTATNLNGATAEGAPKTKAETRAIASSRDTDYPNIRTLTLGTWRNSDMAITFPGAIPGLWQNTGCLWGRPDYMLAANTSVFPNEGSKPALAISADIFKTIRATLPGDGNGNVDPLILKNGAINITKNAEIDLYYLAEGGAYMNVLAYYCYPTDNAPTDPSQIKAQVIAIPNAKTLTAHGVIINDYWDYGALLPGEGVRLHYIDQNGEDKGETFPAGTSIGWIVYGNGYKHKYIVPPGSMPQQIGIPSVGEGAIYSDPKLMQNETPHMAVFRHGDFVVTAFEDCIQTATPNCDYDDVIFHVASTPAEAITPGIPDKDPNPAPAPNVDVDYRGILSLEDNWPYRGDFDMNDVVVEYRSKITMNNSNQITETVDTYTVVWSGATYNNSFAIENKNIGAGNGAVTLEGGDGSARLEGNIIRAASSVLDYANQPEKKTLTVITKYASPIAKENFIYPPYNPFITVKSETSREVHLTNMLPTSNLDTKWLGFGHDFSKPELGQYYITYNESEVQMPFAIDIMFDSDEDMKAYVIPAEAKPIHEHYPNFLTWLQSGGSTNKDWYLHPKN